MEKVEVNINGLPLGGVVKIDACLEKGCLLLIFENGDIQEVYMKNK